MSLVGFNGFHAEVKFFGDLAGSMTLPNKAEHFEFAITEVGDGGISQSAGASDVVLEHLVGDAIAHINLTSQNAADGDQDFFGGFLFHDVAVGASSERAFGVD